MNIPQTTSLFNSNLEFLEDKFGIQFPNELTNQFLQLQNVVPRQSSIDEFNATKSNFAKVTSQIPTLKIKKDIQFPEYNYEYFHESTSNDYEIAFRDYSLSKLYHVLEDFHSDNSNESFISSIILVGIKSPFFLDSFVDWCISNKIRNIAFVDVSINSLVSSCLVVDWSRLFEKLSNHAIKSSFFLESTISDSLSAAVNWLSTVSYYSAVNFYYYIDRVACPEYIEAAALLSDPSAYLTFTAKGFLEDNINMLHNSICTLTASNLDFLDFHELTPLECPIVLVGSGPSLDENILEIQSLQESGCCVIACGSSITTLFESNIIPDYAVLVERNVSVYQKHKLATDYHSFFSKVHLVAASTVDSRIFPYYKQCSIYTRSSNVLASVTDRTNLLSNTHTTSSNAGLAFALSLSPTSLYLYGLDFGSHSKSKSRSTSAHGIGSYALNKVVRGASRSVFTCNSLLRSLGLFDQLLATQSSLPLYSRSIAKFNSNVKYVDLKPEPIVETRFSHDYQLTYLKQPPCSNYYLDNHRILTYLQDTLSADLINIYQCPVTDISLTLLGKFHSFTDIKLVACLIKSLTLIYSSYYQLLIKSYAQINDPEFKKLQYQFRLAYIESLSHLFAYINKLYSSMKNYSLSQ